MQMDNTQAIPFDAHPFRDESSVWGRWMPRILVGILSGIVFSTLAGCVTTRTGGQNYALDREKSLSTRVQLTLSYVQQGNWDAARANLAKAKAISPRDARVHNAEALVLQMEGEPKLAEAAFKRAIKRDGQFSAARNNYGVLLFSQQRYDEAYKEFDRSAKDLNYPMRAQALLNLGRVAAAMDKLPRAVLSLEQALRLNKSLAPAWLLLAQLKFEQQELAQSKVYLERFEQHAQPTATSLGLGIRLAQEFGHEDLEASLWLVLKNRFPYSEEYLAEQRRRTGRSSASQPEPPPASPIATSSDALL